KQYDISEDDLKRYNKQLYSRELQFGETLQIPVFAIREGEVGGVAQRPAPAPVERTVTRPTTAQRDTREHIILPKETKYGIARKYGMTVDELEKLNPKVEVLQPGMMIRVATNVIDEPVIITDDAF